MSTPGAEEKMTHVLEIFGSQVAILCNGMKHDRSSTSRLACNRYAAWVASKLGNVGLHPLESKQLVEKARVQNTTRPDLFR